MNDYDYMLEIKRSATAHIKIGTRNKFTSWDDPFIDDVPNVVVPKFTIDEIENNKYKVNLELEDYSGSITTYRGLERIVIDLSTSCKQETNAFVHNFTFSHLSTKLDAKLSEHFETSDDFRDKMTPDLFQYEGDFLHVMEFSTCENDQAIRSRYMDKNLKYKDALQRRVGYNLNVKDINVQYMVLVVSRNKIASPFILSDRLKEETVARYVLARQIAHDLASKTGIDILQDLTDDMRTLEEILKSIEFTWGTEDFEIDQEMYDGFMSPCDEVAFAASVQQAKIGCVNTFCRRRRKENIQELCQKKLDELKEGERNEKNKNWFSLPLVIPCRKETFSEDDITKYEYIPFREAIRHYNTQSCYWMGKEELLEKAYNDEVSEKEIKKNKSYEFKMEPRDDNIKVEWAKNGIIGSYFSKSSACEEHRRMQKLEVTCNEGDLDEFLALNEENLLSNSGIPSATAEDDLILKSLNINEDDKETFNLIREKRSTKLGQSLSFLSDVYNELAISIKQHNARGYHFSLKKMLHWDALIVVKSTKTHSHLFWTVIIGSESEEIGGTIFKRFENVGRVKILEWRSVQMDKLHNGVNLFNYLMSVWAAWDTCEMGKSMGLTLGNTDGFKHAFYAMCLALENKSTTEEIVTLSRYVYMESFVREPIKTNPAKILSKIPRCRSALQYCLAVKLINHIKKDEQGTSTGFKEDDLQSSCQKIEGLTSFITGEEISTFGKLLIIIYLGYAVDKVKSTEGNQYFPLVKKILEEEEALEEVNVRNCGYLSPNEPKKHEWNMNFLKGVLLRAKGKLANKIGSNQGYDRELTKTLLHKLSRISVIDLATLKASHVPEDSFDVQQIGEKRGKKTRFDPNPKKKIKLQGTKTSKVILELYKLITDKGVLSEKAMFHNLPKLLDFRSKTFGKIQAHIFSKSQHGGMREIFVLDMVSRIFQKFLESIAEVLCNHFEGEAMTHPKGKHQLLKKHHDRVKSYSHPEDLEVITRKSSCDAKRWNQVQFSSKLAQCLLTMTPKLFHPLIVRISNMFIGRKIRIPPELMEQMLYKDCNSQDPLYVMLHDVIVGKIKKPWRVGNEQYLTIRSGMMQGILHFSSSLLHTVVCDYFRDHVESSDWGGQMFVDYQVSSDDSGLVISQFSKNAEKSAPKVAVMPYLMDEFGKLVSIIPSYEKSTYNTSVVYEFNSNFQVLADSVAPIIRWAYACFVLPDTFGIIDRYSSYSNLKRQLLESGAPIQYVHFINILQALQHYKMLGSRVHPLWDNFVVDLSNYPDPAIGYFHLDQAVASGLLPVNFNIWQLCKKTVLGSLMLSVIKKGFMGGDFTNLNMVNQNQMVMQGFENYRRWFNIAKLVDYPNWREELINQKSYLHFLKPDNIDEVKLEITKRIHNANVISSLGSTMASGKSLAASVYLLSSPCLRVYSYDMFDEVLNPNKIPKKIKYDKRSLLSHAKHRQPCEGAASPTVMQLKMMFPFYDSYVEMQNIIDYRKMKKAYPIARRRHYVIHLKTYRLENECIYPLIDVLKSVWYDSPPPNTSATSITSSWAMYQRVYPWLCNTAEETLLQATCPFTDVCGIASFARRCDEKNKEITVRCVDFSQNSIEQFLDSSWWPTVSYHGESSEDPKSGEAFRRLKHNLTMTLFSKIHGVNKEYEVRKYLDSFNIKLQESDILSHADDRLSIILKFFKDGNIREMWNKLDKMKATKWGYYARRQPWNNQLKKYTGKGIWVGYIDTLPCRFIVQDDKVIELYVTKLEEFYDAFKANPKFWIESLTSDDHKFSGKDDFDVAKISDEGKFGHGKLYSNCVEVKVDPRIVVEMAFVEENISVEITGYNIRLVSTDGSRKYTIVSWTPSERFPPIIPPKAGELLTPGNVKNPVFSAYLQCGAVSSFQAAEYIKTFRSWTGDEHVFFRSLMYHSARNLGWLPQTMQIMQPEVVGSEDILACLTSKVFDEFLQDIEAVAVGEPSIEKIHSKSSRYETGPFTFCRVFINYLNDLTERDALKTLMLKGTSGDKDLCDLANAFFGTTFEPKKVFNPFKTELDVDVTESPLRLKKAIDVCEEIEERPSNKLRTSDDHHSFSLHPSGIIVGNQSNLIQRGNFIEGLSDHVLLQYAVAICRHYSNDPNLMSNHEGMEVPSHHYFPTIGSFPGCTKEGTLLGSYEDEDDENIDWFA